MIVNIQVHSPIVTYQVMVCVYHDVESTNAFIWFPLYTSSPAVQELISVVPEYISSLPDALVGSKVIDDKTPVSRPDTVMVLPVNVFKGTLVRLLKVNDQLVGVWIKFLVVTENHVVTDQIVIVPVMV